MIAAALLVVLWLLAVAGFVAVVALAHMLDAARHDRAVDDIIRRRYQQPRNSRCWADTFSPTSAVDLTTTGRTSGIATHASRTHAGGFAGQEGAAQPPAFLTGPVRDTTDVLHDAGRI